MTMVRIVAAHIDCTGATPTQGTRVLLEDGTELSRVYKVELYAETNDLWRAVIHCHCLAPVLPALVDAEIVQDVTSLASEAREFVEGAGSSHAMPL